MTKRIGVFVVLILCAAVPEGHGGGKATFEDVVKQMLETMDSLTTTLATIKDGDTAKGAQPELRKIAGKWKLIKKSAEGLPPPAKEEKDRLTKLYKTKLEEAQKKLFGEAARVSAIPGGRDAILEISTVLEKKAKE